MFCAMQCRPRLSYLATLNPLFSQHLKANACRRPLILIKAVIFMYIGWLVLKDKFISRRIPETRASGPMWDSRDLLDINML